MSNINLLLKNGIVYAPNEKGNISQLSSKPVDIRVQGGLIKEVGDLKSESGETVVDLTGLTVLPGLIDLHAHLRDFDQADLDDFSTGSKSAASGGFTTVVAMANTIPPRDNLNSLTDTLERIRRSACIEILPVAAVTKGLGGAELTNMVELAEAGAVAFSDDGMPIMNMAVMRRALSYVQLAKSFIISHSEDKNLSAGGCMNESPTSTRLGLSGIPAAAEAAAVAREIEVLRLAGGHLHFTHVSTAPSVSLIRRAKEDGLDVTADVTPHHLSLRDEDMAPYDGNFKMNPPLRSTGDQLALLEGIIDGTIDAIATDHAPYTSYQKTRPFEHCSFGIMGFETAFPLVYETLVLSKAVSFERLVEMLTIKPAKILKRPFPSIAANSVANLAVMDLNANWTYDVSRSPSKSRNSPFQGRTMKSKVAMTVHKGTIVFEDKERFAAALVK
ncbi:MAG TPA: dihydroorotase [Oculatellaceae cyanobacterium]